MSEQGEKLISELQAYFQKVESEPAPAGLEHRALNLKSRPVPAQHRWRPLIVGLAVAALMVGVLGSSRALHRGSSQDPAGDADAPCRNSDRGVGYAVASGQLYKVNFCPLKFELLSPNLAAEDVAAGGGTVVAKVRGVHYELTHGSLVPLPALQAANGEGYEDSVSVSPDGLVAFVAARIQRGGNDNQIHIYDPRTHSDTVRLSITDFRVLSSPAWGPDGKVAVLRRPWLQTDRLEVTIASPDGTTQEYPLPVAPNIVTMKHVAWGPSNPLAVSFDRVGSSGKVEAATEVLDPVSGSWRTFSGWQTLSWSPDGRRLLALIDDEPGHRRMELLDASTYARVRDLGTSSSLGGTVSRAAWVPSSR